MKRLFAGLVMLGLAGCSDQPSVRLDLDDDNTSFADAQVTYASDDEFAVLSRNGAVKLGLTREHVYFELSDAVREHVDAEMRDGFGGEDSRIGRTIGSAVRRGVQSALAIDYALRLSQIEDVDYRDGELVFDFVNPDDAVSLDNIEIGDKPVTHAFAPSDARAFIEAFRRVKRGESVRTEASGPSEVAEPASE